VSPLRARTPRGEAASLPAHLHNSIMRRRLPSPGRLGGEGYRWIKEGGVRRPPRFSRSHSLKLRLRLSRPVRGARTHGHRRVRRRRRARYTAGPGSGWDSRRRTTGIRLRTFGSSEGELLHGTDVRAQYT
jgi:hypothetical protein